MQAVIVFQIIQKIVFKAKHRANNIIIIPLPEQWTGGSVHQIHKACHQKCIDTKSDIHIALLQK